jgi:predicted small lipoprotein YifL
VSARRVLAGLLLAALLSGCGMKGDLVLPDREAPPPAPADAPKAPG